MIRQFLSAAAIIGALPNTISNGQTADAIPLMADLNFIVSQVNANAAPLANTALLSAANSFTAVQSGIAATNAANFPIASQVQNFSLNTLSSVLGTNILTARVSALPLGQYVSGQVFTFIPSSENTGPTSINIDSLGSVAIVTKRNADLARSDISTGSIYQLIFDGSRMRLTNPNDLSRFLTLTTNGNFTAPQDGVYLVQAIGGGGAGGGGGNGDATHGGGGGGGGEGGGYLAVPVFLLAGQIVPVKIGAGGSGVAANANGNNGTATNFGSYVVTPTTLGGFAGGAGGANGAAGFSGSTTGFNGITGSGLSGGNGGAAGIPNNVGGNGHSARPNTGSGGGGGGGNGANGANGGTSGDGGSGVVIVQW